jgi:hypothetical protein
MELACNLAGITVGLAMAIYLVLQPRGGRFNFREWLTIGCLMAIVWWVVTIDDDLANTAAIVENLRTDVAGGSRTTSQPDLAPVLLRFALNAFSQGDGFPDWLRFPTSAHKVGLSPRMPDLDNRPPPISFSA